MLVQHLCHFTPCFYDHLQIFDVIIWQLLSVKKTLVSTWKAVRQAFDWTAWFTFSVFCLRFLGLRKCPTSAISPLTRILGDRNRDFIGRQISFPSLKVPPKLSPLFSYREIVVCSTRLKNDPNTFTVSTFCCDARATFLPL